MSQGPAPSALTLARQLGYVPFAEALTMPWSRVVTRKEILERLRTGKSIEGKPGEMRGIEGKPDKPPTLPGMSREDWEA